MTRHVLGENKICANHRKFREISRRVSRFFASTACSRAGFTLLELLIFSAIFAVLSITFMSILVSSVRIQARQSGAAEVGQQSQFLSQLIQYYIEKSSAVEMTADSATSTLTLRMASSTSDPTTIYESGGVVYFKETAGGAAQVLTSSRVTVSNMFFTKHNNSPGHDSVSVIYTMAFNTDSLLRQFSQTFNTVVARVAAATFDANVIPSANNTYKLGTVAGDWQSINNTLFFSGSNVGIGVSSPGEVFQVAGGDVYLSTAGQGVILKNPAGTACYKLTITNGAQLATSSVTCN